MIKARKFLTAGLVAAVFAAGIAADTSALARGRGGGGGRGGFGHGGFGHGGFGGAGVGRAGWGHAGWGHAGWGRGGWGRRGYGYAGYGGWGYGGGWGYDDGWGWPDWGYDGYDYGVAGAALGVATLGAIAAGAAEQNQYYYGYPRAQYNRSSASVSRKGRACVRYQWDALQGYVAVRGPC